MTIAKSYKDKVAYTYIWSITITPKFDKLLAWLLLNKTP